MKIVNIIHSLARQKRGFTMIEIAIALAVIAFALVAIIGILPTGLTAQKGNREETIINQEGPYFLEVIKSGGRGFDHLLNNIDNISVYTLNTNDGSLNENKNFYPLSYSGNLYGSNMVGLLSIPRGALFPDAAGKPVEKVVATVRALSGGRLKPEGLQRTLLLPTS